MEGSALLTLTSIPSLCKKHVNIKNVTEVERKLNIIIKSGNSLLQIITDFDRTLTKSNSNGVPTMSSHAIFEMCEDLPESFTKECRDLCAKFHPIEMSPKMSVEEKLPYMVEWWKQSESLTCGLVIEKDTIDKAVNAANVEFRDGSRDLFKNLNEKSVPILVFSAGIGDVITSVLRHASLNFKNVHVISNFFKFEGLKIIGYTGPAIHIFNKNQHAVENSQYFDDVKHRTSVILMGDSIGDANMDEGLPQCATVLKIGFLSCKHNDEYLAQYLEKFDIVLVDDQSMEVPVDIINCVL